MEDLKIQKTPSTPEIDFDKSGQFSIKGRSLPEDPKKFYEPIFSWAENFSSKKVHLDIKLEYVNTSSSKRIIQLLKIIDSNRRIKKIDMRWYYEIDDLEMLEFGEMIQRNFKRIKTQYLEYEDID
ncbi:MAG: DUF1987 domain-containing protein [Bacteroidales bacterium]|nr:DUF1987 domain-containing protein [Bacteroidales bacterium]